MPQLPDLSQPITFLLAVVMVFAVVMGRYLLVAGIFHLVFYIWSPNKWKQRKLSAKPYSKEPLRKEICWSMITAMIFSITGALAGMLWQRGWMKVYTNVSDYPVWWMPASFAIAVVLHETYYYWLHRWMHHPKIFRVVHKAHHDSNITSPWTAFSFHPLEGLLQAIFLPLLLLLLPMHVYVLLLQLTLMTISSVVNHLDIEIYPRNFQNHALGKWLIGATHHSLHHKQFRYNYGLYFTFWDKWKRTESPTYHKLFDEKTSKMNSAEMALPNSIT
jgi:lathosterol oxidase